MAGELKVFDYTVNILEQLGRGAFGTVYKGFDRDQTAVAIKQVSKSDGRKASTEALKFYYLKQKILHDHVVKVHDVKTWEDSMWIVMEYCDLGDLNDYFHKYHRRLDIDRKINIMSQIATGIAFLHVKDVVHRDIKPGNILLKSNGVNPVVKLGDFGLSKFLDPDDITSGMSSNVGTLWFKAPEFWDRQPDERVTYHRNVDVYAAGLTFAAMLQAEPGESLFPNAESSLMSSETNLPIGFVAFTRCQNRQSEVKVSVPYNSDPPLVKQLKYIIEEMTCFSPQARLAAAEVRERLDTLGRSQNVRKNPSPSTSHFEEVASFGVGAVNDTGDMCYVDGALVMARFSPDVIRVHQEKTGRVLREWTSCPRSHRSTSLVALRIGQEHFFLQGCPTCQVIRGYKITKATNKVLCQNITPSLMCLGPEGTILVLENELKCVKQLRYSGGQLQIIRQFSLGLDDITGLCFSNHHDIVAVIHGDRKRITGLHLRTGAVAWQRTRIPYNSPSQPVICINDIAAVPDGRIFFVANYKRIFVLDPKDGASLYTTYVENVGLIWTTATCRNGNQQRLAVQYGPPERTHITYCDI